MTAVDPSSGWTTLIPGFLLAGAGIGLINPPLASTAVGVVHYTRSGMASGINNTFRQVGIATGIAGLGAVFQHELTHKTGSMLAASAPGRNVLGSIHGKLSAALVSGEVRALASSLPLPQRAALARSYHVGFTSAFTTILLIAAAVALTGALLAFLLVRSRDFVASDTSADADAAPAGRDVHGREGQPAGAGAGRLSAERAPTATSRPRRAPAPTPRPRPAPTIGSL
jgi:hypothetical protein